MSGKADDRLEGRNDTFGGLVIRKKENDSHRKKDERSVLGLDKLAHIKKDDLSRKRQAEDTPDHGLSDSVRRGIDRYRLEQIRGERRRGGIVADVRNEKDKRSYSDRRRDYRSNRSDGKSRRENDATPQFKVSLVFGEVNVVIKTTQGVNDRKNCKIRCILLKMINSS
uniref:PRP38_assoc domain-containing protein n=1 Tax=Heterorhabditis bacteriophora TaxID=37862 RepID=A0A1I7XB72_HETBA